MKNFVSVIALLRFGYYSDLQFAFSSSFAAVGAKPRIFSIDFAAHAHPRCKLAKGDGNGRTRRRLSVAALATEQITLSICLAAGACPCGGCSISCKRGVSGGLQLFSATPARFGVSLVESAANAFDAGIGCLDLIIFLDFC